MRKKSDLSLPWLVAGDPFPPIDQTWGADSEAPGLLAAGGQLDISTLRDAYANGIFPWFSDGQPVLWWSPDPRMVLQVNCFRLHHSLRKTIRQFLRTSGCEIRVDAAFAEVIRQCAGSLRDGVRGTWIVPAMERAYIDLHLAGYAHSVETWIDGELVGGLYCVAIGKAVFGESMFSKRNDASKIALAALICFCKIHAIAQIDCQQNTRHLASMGATEMTRTSFIKQCTVARQEAAPNWDFDALYWRQLMP